MKEETNISSNLNKTRERIIKEIILNAKTFGINEKEKKLNYLVEFVSANPTGPLHVGHCRGAILGDVISNVLIKY